MLGTPGCVCKQCGANKHVLKGPAALKTAAKALMHIFLAFTYLLYKAYELQSNI